MQSAVPELPSPSLSKVLLPRLILIADGFSRQEVADRTVEAVEAGVQWVQLRDHDVPEHVFLQAARELAGRLREVSAEVLLTVNARLRVARYLGVGFHTGAEGPGVEEARVGIDAVSPVGYSAHAPVEGRSSAADYLFFSPVFPTTSKPGHPGAGLAALREFCAALPDSPVFALGGVTAERASSCIEAGAHGIATISGIFSARDVGRAVARYQKAVEVKPFSRRPGRRG
jgi:thiamine-phosphate pyrophosphorylase